MDDPDSPDPAKPQRVYVHWVVYNLSPLTLKLPLNAAKTGLPLRALHGTNDWGKPTYGGPCPSIGKHRYFFKLMLSTPVLAEDPTKASRGSDEGISAMRAVVTYERAKRTLLTRYSSRLIKAPALRFYSLHSHTVSRGQDDPRL